MRILKYRMQSLFNKSKRKFSHDSNEGGDRASKHTKNNVSKPGQKASYQLLINEQISSKPSSSSSARRTSYDVNSGIQASLPSTKLQKIAKLLGSLNEVLDEDGLDETINVVGEEAINRCMDLRTSLLKHKFLIDSMQAQNSSHSEPESRSMSHDFQNIPSSFSPFSVTPWKSSTNPNSLPELPEVRDPTLAAAAFIHVSCGSGRVTDLTYERLEWVGDIYLELTATLLIAQTFPSWNPGRSSQCRESLVKNVTLAGFAKRYGFDKRARLPADFTSGQHKHKSEDLTKIYGDIFEAYTAAVILSDPTDGLRRAQEWLKDLWGQTLQKDIIQEERNAFKVDNPMWRLRGEVGRAEDITAIDKSQPVPLNPKDQLQKMIGAKGIRIRYEDLGPPKKDPSNKLPLFNVGVYLDGWGEKGKLLGSGKANGKKEAGMKAAQMAMQNQKLMKNYIEQKKVVDAQMALQNEAMAKHESM
jgi:ribonuclease-3